MLFFFVSLLLGFNNKKMKQLKESPKNLVGKVFQNKITKNRHTVKEVRKRGGSYRVLLKSPVAMLSEIGFDSKVFLRNWKQVK